MRIARRRKSLAVLLALVSALVGCATTTKSVFEQRGTTVKLQSKRGEDPALDHPVIIAPARLAHILSRLDVRLSAEDGQQRIAAIPLESLELIADGLSQGLREAGPNQRVVVYSIQTKKTFKIVAHQYLTSFIAYVKGENLFVHLSRTDWEIPPRRKDKLPEPKIGSFPSRFRIIPGTAMNIVDQQSVAVAWRDPIFSRPTRTRVSPSGELIRRTILMESPAEELDSNSAVAGQSIPIPPGTSAGALRALADLEEQRQRGEVSELEYGNRRREILAADAPPP
jgi:hypothetical protein